MATRSTSEFNHVQQELFNIAQRTRGSFEATAQLYTKSSNALKEYGYSAKQILTFTETMNKAMAVGGVNADAQASALFQLSQALGSGQLQGDEFKTIAESASIILDTLAEHLGKSRAEIKKMASEGELTSAKIVEAFTNSSGKISAKFKEIPLTFGGAMQQMQNAVLKFVSDVENGSTGISGAMAQAVSFLAQHFDILAKAILYAGVSYASFLALSAVSRMQAAAQGVGLLATAFTRLTATVRALNVAMRANPIGLIAAAIGAALFIWDEFISKIKLTGTAMEVTFGDVAMGVLTDLGDLIGSVANFVSATWNIAMNAVGNALDDLSEKYGETLSGLVEMVKNAVNKKIGSFVAAYEVIVAVWNNFPAAMEALGVAAVNGLVTIIQQGMNFIVEAKAMGKMIEAKVLEVLTKQKRSGGMLA